MLVAAKREALIIRITSPNRSDCEILFPEVFITPSVFHSYEFYRWHEDTAFPVAVAIRTPRRLLRVQAELIVHLARVQRRDAHILSGVGALIDLPGRQIFRLHFVRAVLHVRGVAEVAHQK